MARNGDDDEPLVDGVEHELVDWRALNTEQAGSLSEDDADLLRRLAAVQEEIARGDFRVLLACPSCDWKGIVKLYDIGDGPEWCCPGCDMCWPSNPVTGDDGLTVAERRLRAIAAEYQKPDGG